MHSKLGNIDAFIAVSDYFGNLMQNNMRIPKEKMHIINIGLDIDLYKPSALAKEPQSPRPTLVAPHSTKFSKCLLQLGVRLKRGESM